VDIHRNEGGAATRQKLLAIAEIVVIAFDCKPILQVEAISGHHAARVRRLIGNSSIAGLLVEEPGALNRYFISDFLSPTMILHKQ